MKNEKNNKNKKTVIVGIILLILALLLIVIAVTVGSSKEEHVNSESIVDSTIDNTEDNVSDIVEPGVSDNDIPVAPENGEDDEVGNNGNINKDDADKFTDGDEHDKIGEEKDELNNNTDEDDLETPDSKDENANGDNGENNSGENNNKPTVTPIPSEKDEEDNDGNDKEEDVTPSPTPSEKPVEPTQKPTPSPTPSEKPEKEEDKPSDSKDKVVWNGKEYDKNDAGYGEGGSMTLDTIGTKLPLLPEFNDFGVSDTGIGWVGDDIDEEGLLYDVFGDIRADMIDKGIAGNVSQLYSYDNYALSFHWVMAGGTPDAELWRDPTTGVYTLTICCDLKYDYSNGLKTDLAPWNRDIVKSLLSVMSSTPNQIYDYLYTAWYEDASIASSKFISVKGIDCLVRVDFDKCYYDEETGAITQYVLQFKGK